MAKPPSEFGKRVKQLREMAGISSMRELSRLLGLTECAVGHLEKGTVQTVHIETAAAFAQFFGVTTDWLISGREPAHPGKRAGGPRERLVRSAAHGSS